MLKAIESKLNIVLLIFLIIALGFNYVPGISPALKTSVLVAVGLIATVFVVISAVKAILKRKITVDLLASIALLASFLNQEWVSVVFINLMITSARIFGDYTEGVATSAIKSLLKLRPEKVKVKRGQEIVEVHLGQVDVGDIIVIETGDRVPVDGVIKEGEAGIDQSSLTGESIPVAKRVGDKVFSSTLNVSGSLLVEAVKVGKDTSFEKIIHLIEEAQKNKIEIETLGQKFASWYVVISFIGAGLIYYFSRDLSLVLAVLLVVCADDIAIAVPMAFWSAVGYAAHRGMIIKGADMLEGLTKVKTLVVDKTGTLTTGKIKITGVVAFGKTPSNQILTLIAEAESISEHPIARAITQFARDSGVKITAPEKFEEFPGRGVMVDKGGKKIIAGRISFIREKEVVIPAADLRVIKSYLDRGLNTTAVAVDGKMLGFVTFEDALRPKVKETLENIRKFGITTVYMLTGDNEYVAKKVAHDAGITDYKANLLPEEKLNFIKEHLNTANKVAMVGDGVNDAASLAQADIGIAMGAIGSDAAIESADIALMNDDFSKISELASLARYTKNIALQDFAIWGVVNAIGLVLVFARILGPSGAASFNFITDFFPLVNSLRILRYRLFPKLKYTI